ncbi:MAG: hypothetical protein M3N54_07840 [Acidobacteriota bacterium]|nr:hypothetical protein [Acidobacteriota bacterium]
MLNDISSGELAREIEKRVGLIPTSLDESGRKVVWLDVGRFHFYQGFFDDALRVCGALGHTELEGFVSRLEDLPRVDQCVDSIPPSAFIFHGGRCGSTLLSKVLARSRDHVVFSEAAPHNQIWNLLPPDSGMACDLYRRLILNMGRRRLPSYGAHIIKLTSFNVLQASFIRNAFPGVPALFVFRHPAAMLDSYQRGPPKWLGSKHPLVEGFETPESAVEAFFAAALAIRSDDFQYLDYDLINPQSLPGILRYLRLNPPPAEMPLMLNEFSWNSKSGLCPAPFAPKEPTLPVNVPLALDELYQELNARSFDPARY